MNAITKICAIGDKILNFIAKAITLIFLLYGTYCLWDAYSVQHGAFLEKDLLQFKPTGNAEEDKISLGELKRINEDVIGWITVDKTGIDYPFVIGADNMEYVNKNINGEFALSGAIFIDSRNNDDFSDNYIVFYGHHMENGQMFGDVEEYIKESYFNSHKKATLTIDKQYSVDLFAVMDTTAADPMLFDAGDYNDAEFQKLISYIENNALYLDKNITVDKNTQLIALSTCSSRNTNGRTIVIGKVNR